MTQGIHVKLPCVACALQDSPEDAAIAVFSAVLARKNNAAPSAKDIAANLLNARASFCDHHNAQFIEVLKDANARRAGQELPVDQPRVKER